MADLGKQGTAAPVNTAQPIKAGVAVDWENKPTDPGNASVRHEGVWTAGVGNNDKRKAK